MLACPRCGGRPGVVAIVQDSAVVRAILAYLRLAPGPDTPGPAQLSRNPDVLKGGGSGTQDPVRVSADWR
jgi:hypothetical protein